MSNYTKLVDFAAKDSLPTTDPLKVVQGTEIDTEFTNIQTAVNSKADVASPTFTGTAVFNNITLNGTLSGGTVEGGSY